MSSSVEIILDSLTKSNSAALMVAVISAFLITVMREYFRTLIRLKELRLKGDAIVVARNSKSAEAEGQTPSSAAGEDRPSNVVDFNFKLLERYYEQHLVEYKLMARSSLVVAILGFMVIVIGVFFTFSGQTSVGVVTSIAGLIAEAAAALFFKQNNLLIDQIRDYHKKLVSTQYLLTGISLADELPPGDSVLEKKRIIGNLLFLSNELHGAKSSHLFPLTAEQSNIAVNTDAPLGRAPIT